MNILKGNRRFLWLGGIAVLVLGLVAVLVLGPAASPGPTPTGTDVQVPKMKNVPAGDQKVNLEVEDKR